jgi:HSP20 family protein
MFGLMPRKEKGKVGYPMADLREEFKALYDRFFGGWPLLFAPPYEGPGGMGGLEVKDADKEVLVRAEMPGFEPEEIEIEWLEGRLMIRAGKEPEADKKPPEHACYRYERFVELPVVAVAPEKAEAIYRNGVLEVHLPKAQEALPRRIPIK